MANLILKVTPAEVREKASQISAEKAAMESIMNEMEQMTRSLAEVWNSDSGNAYVDKYSNVKREISDSLNNLETHVQHLNSAAQTYDAMEQEQQNKVNALSDKDIF